MMVSRKYDCINCKTRSCSILEACDLETLKVISTYKHSRAIAKGERLFSEGDTVEGVYFVKKGFLKIEKNSTADKPLILRVLGKGAVLGHRQNLKNGRHTNSATATTDVQYCFIPYHLFSEIVGKSPVLKEQIINELLDELETTEKKAALLAHKSVREKVAEVLLLLADTYGYDKRPSSFEINFSRQDLADLIATTKEQVSKTMKDFEKEGLLKISGKKFTYLDIPAIKNICGCISPTKDVV